MKSIITAFSMTVLAAAMASAQTAPAPVPSQPIKTEKFCHKVMKDGQIVDQCIEIPAGFKKGPNSVKPK